MIPDIYIKSADTSALARVVSALGALFTGRGATETMIQQLVKVESGHLAGDISDRLGPQDVKSAKAGAKENVKTFLNSDIKSNGKARHSVFDRSDQKESSFSGWEWITAGPNFLLGAENERLERHIKY